MLILDPDKYNQYKKIQTNMYLPQLIFLVPSLIKKDFSVDKF